MIKVIINIIRINTYSYKTKSQLHIIMFMEKTCIIYKIAIGIGQMTIQ